MYLYPLCPTRACKGELIVELDCYREPSQAIIKCSRCGYIVAVLAERSAPTPFSFSSSQHMLNIITTETVTGFPVLPSF
jgi:hypothetical protein